MKSDAPALAEGCMYSMTPDEVSASGCWSSLFTGVCGRYDPLPAGFANEEVRQGKKDMRGYIFYSMTDVRGAADAKHLADKY